MLALDQAPGHSQDENTSSSMPLSPSNTEIRLLSIKPGTFSDDIECTLQHADLSFKPVYEALSYCWGKSKDLHHIILDGLDFTITANLDVAIRRVRFPNRPRILWIDAICINQSDDNEKSEQVKSMFNIYSCAMCVLGWTGEASNGSDDAVDLIFELEAYIQSYAEPERQVVHPDALREAGFVPNSDRWASLWSFIHREYWRRLWIVQELVAAGTIIMGDGEVVVDEKCLIGCGNRWFSRGLLTTAYLFVFLMNKCIPEFMA